MSKKPKYTREMLLHRAYRIADQRGISEVNARSLSVDLGCSIQPVYTHFPTVLELRQETFRFACRQFTRQLLSCPAEEDPFRWTTACVLDLARNHPNLFKLIFLSGGFTSRSLPECMREVMSNQRLTARIRDRYELDQDTCEDVVLRSELFLLGIGTMLCSGHLVFTDEELDRLMTRTVADLVRGAREKQPQ